MNKSTLKSRATLIGKVFESKGIKLSRAEQLDVVSQLEGARGWHHASGEATPELKEAEVPFNALQLAAAEVYCCGDFAHMTTMSEAEDAGDTLFLFAMRELIDAGGDAQEAARMLRAASDQLLEVADEMDRQPLQETSKEVEPVGEPVSTVSTPKTLPSMYDSKGEVAPWNLVFLTDRFGMLAENLSSEHPELVAWVENNEEKLGTLMQACAQEMAFVVDKSGEKAVLYEVEIETAESEGFDADGKPFCNVSEADRLVQLKKNIAELEQKHPKLMFRVVKNAGLWGDRLGVWALSTSDKLMPYAEAEAFVFELIKTFY